MPRLILAIETSGDETGLAFIDNEEIRYEIQQPTGARHNETVFAHLATAFAAVGIGVKDLSGIAVSIGPGMFTSLRIGLALAKGLALPFTIPVAAVNTLDGLAWSVPDSGRLVVPVIDARKGEFFTAFYRSGRRITDYRIVVPEMLAAEIGEPALFVGSGLEKVEPVVRPILGEKFLRSEPNIRLPRPSIIALLGGRRLAANDSDPIDDLEPFYLRHTDAEVTREKKRMERR